MLCQLLGQGNEILFLKYFGYFVTPETSLRNKVVLILEIRNHNVKIVFIVMVQGTEESIVFWHLNCVTV